MLRSSFTCNLLPRIASEEQQCRVIITPWFATLAVKQRGALPPTVTTWTTEPDGSNKVGIKRENHLKPCWSETLLEMVDVFGRAEQTHSICLLDGVEVWCFISVCLTSSLHEVIFKKKQPRDKYSSFIYGTSSKSMVLRTILLTSTNIIYQVLSLILLLLLLPLSPYCKYALN